MLIMKRIYLRNLWYTIGWNKVSSWHLKLWLRRVQQRRKVSQTCTGSKSYEHLSKTLYWTRRSKIVNNTKSSYVCLTIMKFDRYSRTVLEKYYKLRKRKGISRMEEVFLKTKSPKNKSCSSKKKKFQGL